MRWTRGASGVALAAALVHAPLAAQTSAIVRAAAGLASPPVVTAPASLPAVAPVAPNVAGMTSASARAIASQAAVANATSIAVQANSAARAAAQALAQTVPNGLVAGGLVPVTGGVSAALDPTGLRTWQGAFAPVQTGDAAAPVVTITQSDSRALLSWSSFNIGRSTTLVFKQNVGDVAVNRIVANIDPLTGLLADPAALAPSRILGAIKADGTVVVINQNGVMFDATAQVNAHSFLASSLDLGINFDTSRSPATPTTLQQRTVTFLQNGLLASETLVSNVRAAVIDAQGLINYVEPRQAEGDITVAAGAAITAGSGGYVIIAAPRITNAGQLSASEGQVSLQSGRVVRATVSSGASDSADPNVRGLLLTSSGATPDSVTNSATGIIVSPRGYISLGGTLNGVVTQAGVLTSTTSVARNGKIALTGASVTLGAAATIAITPDTGKDTIPQSADSIAAFKRSTITIGGAPVLNPDATINFTTSPAQIVLGAGSLIYAPSANVEIGGTNGGVVPNVADAGALASSVLVDANATIDVGGIKDLAVPASRNSIEITPVKRNELRDTPNYREATTDGSFTLNGATVFVDPRLSGVRADGVAWIGSPLIEAGSFFAQVGVTAAELMTSGGNLTLGARGYVQGSRLAVPGVTIRAGATLDVSGGWVSYAAGVVKTTRLLTADGRIVEIGKADPNDNFVGIVDAITATQDRFGFSQSFDNPAFQEFGYEPGYTEGRDAGSLTIKASTNSIAGTIRADAFAGTQQIARAREASAAATINRDLRRLQASPFELPSGGLLKIEALGTGNLQTAGGADIIVYAAAGSVPARPASEILLADSLLSGSGLAEVVLQTSGRVTFDAGSAVTLAPNGALVVDAGRSIRFDGSIVVPSGTIAAQTYEIAQGSVFRADDDLPLSLAATAATPKLFDITVNGLLSARGRWTNDSLAADGVYLGGAYADGGGISLTVAPRVLIPVGAGDAFAADLSGSLYVNAGARLDVTAGGYVRPDGGLVLTARGGDVRLVNQTTYFPIEAQPLPSTSTPPRAIGLDVPGFATTPAAGRQSSLNPRVLEARLVIAPGTIAGQGFGGGGSFTLVTPDLNFGARPGVGGTALSLDFVSTSGFGTFSLTTLKTALLPNVFANGQPGTAALLQTATATIGAGETLNLTQSLIPSLLDSSGIAAVRALGSGGDIAGLLGSAIPADAFDRRAVSLTFDGLTEVDIAAGGLVTGSDGAGLAASKLYNAGTIRLPGGSVRQAQTLPTAYVTDQRPALGVSDLAIVFGPADASGRFDENAPNALGIRRTPQPDAPVLSNADLAGLGGFSRPIYLTATLGASEGIRLAAGSVTDLSGASIRNPRAGAIPGGAQKASGRLVGGGTLATAANLVAGPVFAAVPVFGVARYADLIEPNFNPVAAQRAGLRLTALPGSTIDLRGASDQYDQETALGVFTRTPVWSDGGRLTLGAGGSVAGSRILAQGGAARAEGGTLTWLDPVLRQTDAASPPVDVVAADQIMAAGFDTFVAQDRLTTLGDVGLTLGRAFYLTARPFNGDTNNLAIYRANLAATGTLAVRAPYIHLESPAQSVVPVRDAVRGTAAITLAGQTIDIVGAVYAEQSVAALTLDASGDVRLTGVQPPLLTLAPGASLAAVASSLGGQLVVNGDLTIRAAQVYPTTGTGSLQQDVNAVRAGQSEAAVPYLIASTGADATIRFVRAGSATPAVPYSAGGNLLVQAARIDQGGVVRVPLGRLVLGANAPLAIGPSLVSQMVPATRSVTLAAGGITSVSAGGLNIPYGTTTDLIEYFFTPTSDGRLFAPPAAELRLAGDRVDIASAATVDATGGGDLYAYEFVPGVGGSRDVLSRFNSDPFSSRNGLQFPDGRQVYAIVPSLADAGVATIDPLYAADYGALSGTAGAGRRVFLEAAPGLAAGWYTLLPAQYALLPGGLRIVENSGAPPPLNENATLRDGSIIVGGRYGVAGTAIEAAQRTGFTVQSQATIRKFSNLQLTSASQTFGDLAARDGLAIPRLPADAARLVLNPLSELSINTKFLTTPASSGRGAQVDIAGNAFRIVAPGADLAADAGTIVLTTDAFANLSAASLLIGGIRTDRADGSTGLFVTTAKITVANDAAHPLTAPEIVLAVDGVDSAITIADGAAIIAGAALADSRAGDYIITASDGTRTPAQTAIGGIVRVASGPERLIARPGELALANSLQPTSIAIGEATLTGTAILLDSSRDLSITDNVLTVAKPSITATTLALGGDDIFFTAAPSGFRGLTITPDLEAQFARAGRLTITTQSVIGFSAGTHAFNDLRIDARGIRPHGQAVKPPPVPRDDQFDVAVADPRAPIAVTIKAREFSYANSDGGRSGCGELLTVTSCGDTGNTLAIEAGTIRFGSGTMRVFGFDRSVAIAASQGVYVEGVGSFDVGLADLVVTTPFFGDRALTADPRAAKLQPALTVLTAGGVALTGTGAAAGTVAAAPGATLAFGDIDRPVASFSAANVDVRASAGILSVRSTGSIVATGATTLETPGYAKTFGDAADQVLVAAPGGSLSLVSLAGDVALGSATRVAIGGGTGTAGALTLSAARGRLTLPGTIDAIAPEGAASLALDSGLQALDLAAFLRGAGAQFTGDVRIRTGAGGLAVAAGQTLRAASVRLTADGGLVDIAGSIDTSGINGGAIGLFGTAGVTLRPTALLNASASGYAAGDTRAATGGRVELGTSGTGALIVASDAAGGAVIDVAARRPGARLVAQLRKDPVTLNDRLTYNYAQSDTGGTVGFRAPALGPDGGESVNIAFAGTIRGAREVSVEGFRTYDLKALALADCAAADICVNPAGQLVLDVNAAPAGRANILSATAPGTISQFVRSFDLSASSTGLGTLLAAPNFHARPGIELAYDGDIVLASNWNFAAGVVNIAAATADGLIKPSPQLGNDLVYIVPGSEGAIFNRYTDFTYRTGGKASGEAGVLTLRAGGNLDIRGSITDGFFSFADQTQPDYLSFQLGGGDRQYRPAFDVNCGTAGTSCADLASPFEVFPGAKVPLVPPSDSVNISIAKLVRGQDLADLFGAPVAPYNPLANTPGARESLTGVTGDPIGSAAILPALADGRPAASFAFRLVGGTAVAGTAAAVSADPLAVAAGSTGTVSVSGETSYRAAPVIVRPQRYAGDLQLSIADPNLIDDNGNFTAVATAPGDLLDRVNAAGLTFDPTLYTRLAFTAASPAVRAYFTSAARRYFADNGIAADQYQFFGPATAPTALAASAATITRFLQAISADFGARVRRGEFGFAPPVQKAATPLANPNIYTRSLVRTGTGSIDVVAAGDIDLTNGKPVFRNFEGRNGSSNAQTAQVGGTAIYTVGHAADTGGVTATVTATGQTLTLDAGPAAVPAAVPTPATPINLQGVLDNPPVLVEGGGAITLTAGRDVLARRDAWSESFRVPVAAGGFRLYANVGSDTQLWRVVATPLDPVTNEALTSIRINPQLFSTGVGALGGGDVSVRAGRDVSQLTAVSDTSVARGLVSGGTVPAPALQTFGGGNVAVRAGGDVRGGIVDVASGTGVIASGGSVVSAGSLRLSGTNASPSADPEPNRLRVGVADGTVAISAIGSVEVAAIASSDGLAAYSPVAGVASRGNGSFRLDNRGKNVTTVDIDSNAVAVLPGSLEVAALAGDIALSAGDTVNGGQRTQLFLTPSPIGQLRLFAGGDLAAVTLNMDDGDPSLLPGSILGASGTGTRRYNFPAILPNTSDTVRRLIHNQRTTHAGDPEPVRIFAGGDIDGVTLSLPKQARIGAGGDIIDMVFIGQNVAASDVTRITAGRDIVASSQVLSVPTARTNASGGVINASLPVLQGNTFTLGGPGALFLEAGRDLGPFLNSAIVRPAGSAASLSYAGGVVSVGNGYNPWLGEAGARIYTAFGVGKGSDYTALRNYYVDPANVGALDGDLFVQVPDANGNKLPDRTRPIYGPILIDWLAKTFGTTYPDATTAYAAFLRLPLLVQRQFLLDRVYFNELAAPSRPDGPSYLQYVRGYRAVNLLFPPTLGYTANDLGGTSNGGTKVATGNLDLRLATIETQRGGDITILGPGGRVLGGSVVATAAQAARRGEEVGPPGAGFNLFAGIRRTNTTTLAERIYGIPIGFEGVLTLRGGNVNGFTDGDFLLNQSRLFTISGGNVTLWSSNGDLNAGQGAKTTANNPPVVVRFDPNAFGILDQAGSVTGAGINAQAPADSGLSADVTLIAPVGTVDAGDAGVRAGGNVFVAAAQIANADNFKVGGTAIGIGGAVAVNLGAAAAANAASGAAAQAAAAVNPTGTRTGDERSRISVEVLGFAGDAKDDPCNKPADTRPANCPAPPR